MENAWWGNQGHQRALAIRNARLAKTRRSWSMVGFVLGCWGIMWILGATFYLYSWDSRPSVDPVMTSKHSYGSCEFIGPVEGFLDGCVGECGSTLSAFGSLREAMGACLKYQDCGGVTSIPWEPGHRRFEIRANVNGKGPRRTGDGQLSFLRRCNGKQVFKVVKMRAMAENDRSSSSDSKKKVRVTVPPTRMVTLSPEEALKEKQIQEEVEKELLEQEQEEQREQGDQQEQEEEQQNETPPDLSSNREEEEMKEPQQVTDSGGPLIIEEPDDGSYKVTLWEPPSMEDEDLDAMGSEVDGLPTIFIGIASYRDPMCHETIEGALRWAKHPERLFFGVVEQNAPIDLPCFHTKVSCEDDPSQLLCKHRSQIRIHKVSAKAARGPTFGRHRADSLYRGEYYALQIDAHMYFTKNWDEDMILQFQRTKNEYAILSTYPTDHSKNTYDDVKGLSKTRTTPIICQSSFVGHNQMGKHGAANEFAPPKDLKSPILQIWWAAGISFSRGHRLVRVPYDCCLPMLFDGEETSMAYRAWTHGYDFYTFHHSLVFHPYNRKHKPPLFWENEQVDHSARANDLSRSENRLRKIYGLEPNAPFDTTDIERYSFGNKRPIQKFWKLFGIDYKKNKIVNNCVSSTTASIHYALTPYLRKDMKGIDYTKIDDKMNFGKAARRAKKRLGEYATMEYDF